MRTERGKMASEFDPKMATIDSVVAWVRFPDLPAPLFDKKFLLSLGNSIGKAIRLDIHTAQRTRGKFARMCVELDLTKPLIPEFCVERQMLSVVYESLGALCQHCGRVEDDGGRWKTVNRPRRQRNAGWIPKEQQGGSRFSVLRDEFENGKEKLDEPSLTQQNVLIKNSTGNLKLDSEGRHSRSPEVSRGMEDGSKKIDGPGGEKKGSKGISGRILSVNRGISKPSKSGGAMESRDRRELNPVSINCGGNSSGSFVNLRKQGVLVYGKENLNPGASDSELRNDQAMLTEEANVVINEELCENGRGSLKEVRQTPKLAD
ncbi:hypothetical protein K1719_039896 [Acacia pycnantha]|nr:hypothetical protein K1719_039896 [Acacia pycnantha]